MSDDPQSIAEGLDPDEIGDDPSGDLSYPPDRPLGVNDPTRDDRVEDSVASRSAREEPDFGEPGYEPDDDALRLVAPNDVLADDESEAVALGIVPDDEADLSAEEAAVHPIADPDLDG